ncbi:MAG: Hpt domain-containing protein [Kiloniellales bacterium]
MSETIIDKAALERLLDVIGGESEDLQELIDDFIDNAPNLAGKIESAGGAGDWDSVRIAAHTLKSNARDFGAIQLADLCASLEQQCKDQALETPEITIAMIVEQEQKAREALTSLRVEDIGPG